MQGDQEELNNEISRALNMITVSVQGYFLSRGFDPSYRLHPEYYYDDRGESSRSVSIYLRNTIGANRLELRINLQRNVLLPGAAKWSGAVDCFKDDKRFTDVSFDASSIPEVKRDVITFISSLGL